MPYIPRIVDSEIRLGLESAGVVVVEGPKACGKTESALQVAESVVRLDIDQAARAAAQVDPSLVLDGPAPRLIDEWQVEPGLWNHARHLVDQRQLHGQFILTGSAVPDDDIARHTGAGRFTFVRMRPMSLAEGGWGTSEVSLGELMDGVAPASGSARWSIPELSEYLVRGGWPAQRDATVTAASRAARDYLRQVCEVDVARLAGNRRDPLKVGRLVASLARNTATEASLATLVRDTGGPDAQLARDTVSSYLDALTRVMVIEDQPAWAPHLRSSTPMRQAPTRHFVDPSLALAALGATPARVAGDLEFLGLLFESLVVRDLRILAQPLGGTVFHYRDKNGLEIDAVVQLADGRWGAFEVKLGGDRHIEAGAASLRRLAALVDPSRCGPPSILAVITMSGYGYRRDDGIAVIPVRSLAP